MARRTPQRGSAYRSYAVVFEDEHLLVVTKPGGLLTNMAERGEQTLQDQIRKHTKKSSEPDAVAPSAAHRLDRFTSGLVLFGKTQLRARQISSRVGELECVVEGERVRLIGRCVEYARARIETSE